MPTVFTHAVLPLALGRTITEKKMPIRFWLLAPLCSVLPDADVITFSFGIEYGHFFGHRGFFHSFTFAFLLSLIVMFLAFHKTPLFSKKWWLILTFFFVVTASHGLLDAFTDGGLGIALFSPFDTTRYFFPWRPLRVSPIGIGAFFKYWGNAALFSEIIWLWIPLTAMLAIVETIRKKKSKS